MGLTLPGHVPPAWTGGCIQRVDLATGEVTTLYTESSSGPLRAPNDLVFDAHGGFWFTDHGVRLERSSDRTGLHYAKADGSSCVEVVFPMDGPNGIGLSPDGSMLYAAETHTGRVFQWAVTGPGEVPPNPLPIGNGGSLLAGLPGTEMLDSLAVDGEGWVCVGTLGNGGITVDLARRGQGRAPPAAGPARHQHLLRGPGPAHGLRHAVRHRAAGVVRVAPPGPRARPHRVAHRRGEIVPPGARPVA